MTDKESIVTSISQKLSAIENLGDGIYRGQRIYDGRIFATAYFDLSDHVIERAKNLSQFQEKLIGNNFFDSDSDQRWNSYLYIWAGPESKTNQGFAKAKAQIERDRHYARKFVVEEEDLIQRLDIKEEAIPNINEDASNKWAELLRNESLGLVLHQYPRTQLIDQIASGEAFKFESTIEESKKSLKNDPLSTGFLKQLSIGTFRPILDGKDFEFGRVNLIFGQNGTGKTSLMESIEALYCGRARRDANATLKNSTAQIFTPNGGLVTVKSEHAASIFKDRNLSWYGRSNPQSDAISHSFTRFNFLDTDAAFRMAGETDAKKIREDLSLLLVGAESATLWTYLTKLRQDSVAKSIGFRDRIPAMLSQTELLASEVERLKTTPSASNTLIKTFRSNLRKVGIKWLIDDTASLNTNDRIKLEYLYKGFGRAITISQSSVSNWQTLNEQILNYSNHIEKLDQIVKEFVSIEENFVTNLHTLELLDSSQKNLKEWLKFCEAGAPALADSIKLGESLIAQLRNELGSFVIDEIRELPTEYESLSLQASLDVVSARLQEATERERVNTEHLQYRERLGQSLSELRVDLHGLLNSIIERTGDTLHCPVCETYHQEGELLHKIQALIKETDSSVNLSFRQAVQDAKDQVSREREALLSLKELERYAMYVGYTSSITVRELRLRLFDKSQELKLLNENLERSKSSVESLNLLGIDWSQYSEIRELALDIMKDEENLSSVESILEKVKSLSENIDSRRLLDKEFSEELKSISDKTVTIAKSFGLNEVSPRSLMSSLQNTLILLEVSLEFLNEALALIEFRKDQSFQDLQLDLSDLIEDFDKANHAIQSELSARMDIENKTKAYEDSSNQLKTLSTRHENLSRANKVFEEIINNYSLQQATQDALRSIGGNVGSIFTRIHSPCEYRIGDFMSDNLLQKIDGGKPHGVHQVSTGQRAALALSIFLALNRSAISAPPVMLIDDPVAHIDDLNALSFLDYLRDIVISSRKQIFFATADAKFAALFQRKFEFLGEDSFKKIIMSR